MGYHKGHKEFHALDMEKGWHTPPGYPSGIQQKIIAGELELPDQESLNELLKDAGALELVSGDVDDIAEQLFDCLKEATNYC